MRRIARFYLAGLLLLSACAGSVERTGEENEVWRVLLKELSDADYPDNPDISIRSQDHERYVHDSLLIRRVDSMRFDFVFLPGNANSDSLILSDLDISEFIPLAPGALRKDPFLSRICLQNQEFNRQQVKFRGEEFESRGDGDENQRTSRLDLARNCLNAGLWELITYAGEPGQEQPMYHAWFDFPMDLYAELFEMRNPGLKWDDYKGLMKDWTDLPQDKVDVDFMREAGSVLALDFESGNEGMYPMKGERRKKFRNVMHPREPGSIGDFLTDSATFATFSPPGFYNQAEPKHTQLGRLHSLDSVWYRRTAPPWAAKDSLFELELLFRHGRNDSLRTRLIFGGISLADLPALRPAEANQGFQMPMGIANHSFYETLETHRGRPSATQGWYALSLEADYRFLDSHNLGIDGPLLHLDAQDPKVLHLWLLSFERHALVGHYRIRLPD